MGFMVTILPRYAIYVSIRQRLKRYLSELSENNVISIYFLLFVKN